ncbi:hypothetical protein UFOVP1608_42 [uncultured Caudovirales phage]|uniref:Uncharacterized protein n=1 Tax=uncultured Caudovirales phage TaxID=2100421 RepID=A0A6J5SSV0_9CAUD|nr:hypothetical protein UFOVP1608_42 [uncultured Caudovirales phage]
MTRESAAAWLNYTDPRLKIIEDAFLARPGWSLENTAAIILRDLDQWLLRQADEFRAANYIEPRLHGMKLCPTVRHEDDFSCGFSIAQFYYTHTTSTTPNDLYGRACAKSGHEWGRYSVGIERCIWCGEFPVAPASTESAPISTPDLPRDGSDDRPVKPCGDPSCSCSLT